jgi:hypothetical protein
LVEAGYEKTLEAEHKMGEMLQETERARGKRTDLLISRNEVDKPSLFFGIPNCKKRDHENRQES